MIEYVILILGFLYLFFEKFFKTKKDETHSVFQNATKTWKLFIILGLVVAPLSFAKLYYDNNANEIAKDRSEKRRVVDSLRMQQINDSLIIMQKNFKDGLLMQYQIDTAILHTSSKNYTITLDQYKSMIKSFSSSAQTLSQFKDRIVNPLKVPEFYMTIKYAFNPFKKNLTFKDLKTERFEDWSKEKMNHWNGIRNFIGDLIEDGMSATINNSNVGAKGFMDLDLSKQKEELSHNFEVPFFELTPDDSLLHSSFQFITAEIYSKENLYSVYDFEGSEIEFSFDRTQRFGALPTINFESVWIRRSNSSKNYINPVEKWQNSTSIWFKAYGFKIESISIFFTSTAVEYVSKQIQYAESGNKFKVTFVRR